MDVHTLKGHYLVVISLIEPNRLQTNKLLLTYACNVMKVVQTVECFIKILNSGENILRVMFRNPVRFRVRQKREEGQKIA